MIDSLLAAFASLVTRIEARLFSEFGVRSILVPIAILLITVGLEMAARRNWRLRYGSRNFRVDVLYYIFYYGGFYHLLIFSALYGAMVRAMDAWLPFLKLDLLAGMPAPLQMLAMLLAADFIGYWSHRLRHASAPLWAFHAIHHSQTRLTVMSNYRFHVVDETVLRLCLFVPFYMMGPGVEMWLALNIAFNWILLLQHSEWNWTYGPLGRVFVSPVFHRHHHALEERQQNGNYGMLFTFWDDLFGTAIRGEPAPERHGLAGNPVPETLWGQLVYPFQEIARSWRGRAAMSAPVATQPAEK